MNDTSKTTLVFIGTQRNDAGEGVHVALLDESTGVLTPSGVAAVIERPTWVMTDAGQSVLFAVSEVGNTGDRIGDVFSFAIDRVQGRLAPIGQTPSGGGGPTHLALDPGGRALFVANFGGGQVAVVPIAADGALAPVSAVQTGSGSGPHRRQTGPHAHGVTLDPSGRFLLAPDMGADRIFIHRYDRAAAALSPAPTPFAALPAGSGPRLLLFGKDGRFAYLLTELSAEIFVFAWNAAAGALTPRGSIALDAPGFEGAPSAAAFAMSQDGRFLYASNRATHAIQVYAIDPDEGGLSHIQTIDAGGEKPWAAEIAPAGEWMLVANQGSDVICLFSIDRATGRLAPAPATLAVRTPTSIAFIARDEGC